MGAFQSLSWSHEVVLGAILWAFTTKIDKVSEELILRYPHEEPCVVQPAGGKGEVGPAAADSDLPVSALPLL